MAMQKWEYRRTRNEFDYGTAPHKTPDERKEAWLNAMGEEGWELIGYDGPTDNDNTWYLFKRPKQ
tara:strand:- start:323 stop:517 length:195 start_codon:yes stop_codon:yes gene_type:complete